jgi:hypothetical protein
MAEKKAFALRIDSEILKALEKWAADEFRSINGQIEYLLHQAVIKSGRLKDAESAGGKTKGKEPKS